MGLGTLGFHRFLPSFRLTGTQKTPRPPWSSPRATGVPRTVVVGRSGSAPESRRIEKGGVRERGSLATSNHLEDESRKLSGRNSECFSFSPLWDHGICVPTPRPGLGLAPASRHLEFDPVFSAVGRGGVLSPWRTPARPRRPSPTLGGTERRVRLGVDVDGTVLGFCSGSTVPRQCPGRKTPQQTPRHLPVTGAFFVTAGPSRSLVVARKSTGRSSK